MSFQWQAAPSDAFGDLTEAYVALIHGELLRLANRYVPIIEAWLKENAPWVDRTGNARQSLWSDVFDIANSAVVLILSHGVEYGEFLELSHGGSWAVIGPALDHFIPLIWRDIENMLRL